MMYELTVADKVWNRACMEDGGDSPKAGDRALADMLRFHGFAMNGGIAHAIEILDESELSASKAGYVYFGWADYAGLISSLSDLDEDTIEERYPTQPDSPAATDNGLFERFLERFASNPEDFYPI